MTTLNVLQAINSALAHEMEIDDRVLILGEDVGTAGGIFRATQGLQQQFGADRVIDTPLDELGIVGHAVGMALYGLRPVAEVQFAAFIANAFEQIMFAASKYRWLTGGEYSCPLVIRAPSFGGIRGGFWHSHSPEAFFAHGGGIKVIVPTTPQNAYGLTLAAIRDPDPTLVLEPVPLYRTLSGEVLEDGTAMAIGTAEVVRPGTDLTIVTYGPMRHAAARVADAIAGSDGFDVEVVDLLTLIPFDLSTIVESARRTGRVIILHEASLTGGFGAELAAVLQDRAFGYLHAPVDRVAGHDLPYSFSTGDQHYKPSDDRIRSAIRQIMEFTF
jgi:pyruvate/2-oxoglutarate/acetoin dehydrogenase E1 component